MLIMSIVVQSALFAKKVDYIIIQSRGGYTVTIWPIQLLLEKYPDATVVITDAMSAAAFLSVRLPNKRVIDKQGMMLFHKVYTTVKMSPREDARLKVVNYALMWDAARLMNMTYMEYRDKVINGDWIILPDELLLRGIVSEIVNIKIDNSYYK